MIKSKGLTFFLSFIPGAGHLYLGLMNRGLQFLLLFFGTIFISNLFITGMFGFFLPVIWLYSMFDALQQYNKINETGNICDTPIISWSKLVNSRLWIGWGLIIFGIYLFVEKYIVNTYGWQFASTFKTVFFAVTLILIGIYLLIGKRQSKNIDKEAE